MSRIIVKNLKKEFKIGIKKNQSVLERFVGIFSGMEYKTIMRVLDGISFELNPGEVLGITGRNGCGKSTLLRVVAGIYRADSGIIDINGKVISLINLWAGLKERLTMRENIFLTGSLFGLSRKEIRQKFSSIVDFSGLNEFVDAKLYQFSGGMMQRVAFSVAVHSDPDILLLDEVFEVGDEDFKRRSAEKIKEIVACGGAAILVSHEENIIKKYCSRLILMDKGKIIKEINIADSELRKSLFEE